MKITMNEKQMYRKLQVYNLYEINKIVKSSTIMFVKPNTSPSSIVIDNFSIMIFGGNPENPPNTFSTEHL